jgi:hypothetical protein
LLTQRWYVFQSVRTVPKAEADDQNELFVRNKAWSEKMWDKDPDVSFLCIQAVESY